MRIQTQEELISTMTMVGVAIAGVLTIVFSSGVFTLWSSLVGVILLLLLLTYSRHGDVSQTRMEHVVSSAVFALSSLLLLGWLLQLVYQILDLTRYAFVLPQWGIGLSITWGVFAFALWLIAVLIWLRVHPRQRWPRLFQTIAQH
jgi:hypothetical protein